MTKLYFIGGASGSGKTAIMNELQNILGDKIKVYDFDDIGVPEGADKKWRQESTAKWLQKLLNEGKDACLLGQIVLGEILACPSANQIDKVNFCLLDVSDFQRIQRLKKRSTYGADQNMLNWSAWLRMHHQDPKWTQHVLKENCWDGLDFSSWDQLESWDDKASIELLETTNFSIEDVARKVTDWINRKPRSVNLINDKLYNELKNLKSLYGWRKLDSITNIWIRFLILLF
ncbi:DEAD/DEAH box helicase family protein [Legionella tunisiensis]|uniref:AAA family ATPase n=1 Tax=Legionella tunisiensis TaxID=1034944 RepID=UPI0002DEC6FD|nr:AAA family ATPase [Legionella tunisiensis]